ncbi:DUF6603 domain-containing protein [Streptomyces cinnamoneus]|uniref:DUF6603 domain-containing protein n=1 Tax=Streptomyces cinnamoneus TaxID=53446 RepID=A0A918WF26_STRCJ|nr:DUF6603 domain-containing protein [Streptomyces cinnamoneus]GHC39762.1 hypothetical protein GCM10010507_12130 [Streptomyces cinnamoneus]
MTLPVSALREKLVLPHGMLVVTPEFLQLPPATDLFTTHLPDGVLRVLDAVADQDRLTVTGLIQLSGHEPRPGTVSFLTGDGGDGGEDVVGIRIDVPLAGSDELPETLRPVRGVLDALAISTVHLVLGVEPGPTGELEPRIGFGVELDFPTGAGARPYLWGYPPLSASHAWSLAGSFHPVKVDRLDDLQQFAHKTGDSTFALPPDLAAVAGALSLTDLVVTFAPPGAARTAGFVQSVWLRVDVAGSWKVFDELTVGDLHAEFGAIQPFGPTPRLQGLVGGTIGLTDDIGVAVQVDWKDRQSRVSGTLLRPVRVQPLLEKHFPGFPVGSDLTVSELSVHGEFGGENPGYGVDLLLDDVLKIADGVELSQVALSVRKEGGTTRAACDALWTLGDSATLNVHGEWEKGGGWLLSARASHLKPAEIFGLFGIAPPPVLKDLMVERLAVTYDSAGKTFGLEAGAQFPLGDISAWLSLDVTLTKRTGGQSGYDQNYTGGLTLEVPRAGTDPRTLTFTVKNAQHAEFTAEWTDTEGVSLADLAALLGVQDATAAQILSRLGTADKIIIGYSSVRRSVVFSVHDKGSGGSLVVASVQPKGGPRAWVVRATIGLQASLSQVPLLHGQIPDGQDLGVRGLGVVLASEALTGARLRELGEALTACDSALPALPADGVAKGATFAVDLLLPGRTTPVSVLVRAGSSGGSGSGSSGSSSSSSKHPALPSGASKDAAPAGTPAGAPADASAGASASGVPLVAWVDVQRAVGPLNLRRVGVGFADQTVWVLFDASLGMAGLELGVEGLGLGIPLADPAHPEFRLDGLSVGYSRPPLAIKGALVNQATAGTPYETLVKGVLVVSAEKFGLTALGAYARAEATPDVPSLFLFGRVSGQFGGPPPVQITGIMAGFGLNTTLRLPEGDQVLEFPFLKDMTSTSPDADPLKVLDTLMGGDGAWVRPASGQMWFAAGLAFKVFEFIDGQALLALEVGDDFAVALLGTAEARFPKDAGLPEYARVRLGLSAKYRASEQVLKITAQLAPGSYLIDEACVLTGGFALYTWFDDAHAGDFVLTLGGYHPKYTVPAHYPKVPKLGFSWPVTRELTISGGAYFALTPGAVMAGGALDVNYRSGDLHAWLTAHADMLIEWAPFRFDVEIGISIGVSYVLDLWLVRETIRVEVGASLRLWGPPTAGEVTIHLWFISFTIAFGDGNARDDTPAPWPDVVKQLPAREDAVRLSALDGLSPTRAKDGQQELWVVGPGAFSFAVRTAVPVTTLILAAPEDPRRISGHAVDIRPRRDEGKGLQSVLTVTLTRGQGTVETLDLRAWYAGKSSDVRQSLPAALWGPYDGKLTPNGPQRVDDQLVGVDLRLPPPEEGGTPGPIEAETLAFDDRTPDGALPLRPPVDATPVALQLELQSEAVPVGTATAEAATVASVPAEAAVQDTGDMGDATDSMSGTTVDWARDRLFAAMDYLDVSPGTNERLAAEDTLVAGDVKAKIAKTEGEHPLPTGERLYVLGAGKTVTPVDVHGLTAYEPFTLQFSGATHMAVGPDGSRLCAVDDDQRIDVRDISENPPRTDVPSLFTDRIWGYQKARGASVSPDSKWAYVTSAQSNQMLVLDLASTPPRKHQDFGAQTRPGEAVPAARWDTASQVVYLAKPDKGVVTRIDVTGGKWPVELGDLPAGPDPTRLAVDPRGRWIYVLNEGHSTVTVVDLAATGIVATLRTGTDPSALAVSPDGNRLYVAAVTTGTVSVFDVSGAAPQEVGEPVWVGPEPVALAVSADGARLFVARSKARQVQVVDTTATPPVLLPVTVPLTDDPVALAVTVPPKAPEPPAAPSDTRTTEGGTA